GPSPKEQALPSFVYQEVRDDGGSGGLQPAARRLIPGLQLLKLLAPVRAGEQRLQFPLPLLERLLGGHPSSFRLGTEAVRSLDELALFRRSNEYGGGRRLEVEHGQAQLLMQDLEATRHARGELVGL